MLFPILDIISLRKKQEGKKMLVYFILEPARLLRAYKPGSRARMDSRTGMMAATANKQRKGTRRLNREAEPR